MNIAITTVDRSPRRNFVEQTLASMLAKDQTVERYAPIRIITDGEDMNFLGPWKTDRRLVIETTDKKPHARTFDGIRPRVVMANVRAMQAVPHGGSLLLLEDDLVFAPRWLERTERIIERIRADIGSTRFMLALYTPFELTSEDRVQFEFAEREGYCACIRPTYYGSQAIYYGAEALQTVLGDMKQLGLVEGRLGSDEVVPYTSVNRDVPLLAAVPSLVQHVGADSTWLAPGSVPMHQSPTFRDEDEVRPSDGQPERVPEPPGGASFTDVLERLGP